MHKYIYKVHELKIFKMKYFIYVKHVFARKDDLFIYPCNSRIYLNAYERCDSSIL